MSYIPPTQGELTIIVNNQLIRGWQEIHLTRSIEAFSHFAVRLTDKYPFSQALVLDQGDPIVCMLGNDVVLTGYVDDVSFSMASTGTTGEHQMMITGRSKCCDLQDSSVNNAKIYSNIQPLPFAQELVMPFGRPTSITASQIGQANGSFYPVLGTNRTMAPLEPITLVAHYSGLLVYDDPNGNLVLASVGAGSMGSGIQEGVNVQAASYILSGAHRFSDYYAVINTVSQEIQGLGGNNQSGHASDPEVKRYRPKVFQGPPEFPGLNYSQLSAQWQANRGFGMGHRVQVVVDSWRDVNGLLWQINYYCSISLPSVKVVPGLYVQGPEGNAPIQWVIGEVTYRRDLQTGTTAELTLMPKQAFTVEPVLPFGQNINDLANPSGNGPQPQPSGQGSTNPNLDTGGGFPQTVSPAGGLT